MKRLSPQWLVSLLIVLTYAAERGKPMLVCQMDVITAFFNGDFKEEIYMEQPPSFVQEGKQNLACKLNKSLYGLKQSPRCWKPKEKFTSHMKALVLKRALLLMSSLKSNQ
uniref:Reverse transcriptase Ty1/copia-type domain-containing protein n=1 Tax=Amphimedon queenslandica TaxID=400682 RepID=A0A1X7TRU8_AMPQE